MTTWKEFLFSPVLLKDLSIEQMLVIMQDDKMPLFAHSAFANDLLRRKGIPYAES